MGPGLMARKNIFATPDEPANAPELQADVAAPNNRPLLGLALAGRDIKKASPLGALGQSLEGISRRAERAEEIERRLSEGQAIIELDPADIDASFIADRMTETSEGLQSLVESIRQSGQQVPILVRPHPAAPGRYQIAYGHRRNKAAVQLGLKVRAVVRDLSDQQLVVAQGQENNERADLSFIERARFAATLEQRGFDRETIMSALSVDKAALSKMISIATRIPGEIIAWIGAAPQHGRHRWLQLSELLQEDGRGAHVVEALKPGDDAALSSDERFEKVLNLVLPRTAGPRAESWTASDGTPVARITRTTKTLTLQIDQKVGAEFGEFLVGALQELYDKYTHAKS
jgi:ParB family chromosome partitioning protein